MEAESLEEMYQSNMSKYPPSGFQLDNNYLITALVLDAVYEVASLGRLTQELYHEFRDIHGTNSVAHVREQFQLHMDDFISRMKWEKVIIERG